MLRPRAQALDLWKECAEHAQLVQRQERAAVAAFADEQLPELEVGFTIGLQARAEALQFLDEQIARIAVDGDAGGFGRRVEADHVGRAAREDFLFVDGYAAVPELEGRVDRLRLGRTS